LLEAKARFWPVELRFRFGTGSSGGSNVYRREQARTIVETADRTGLLRMFIRRLEVHEPRMAPVLTIYDAITTWFFTPLADLLDAEPS